MREYEPIWNTIKEKGKATLRADPSLHARIKKAVIKEKHLDTAFALLKSNEGHTYRLKIETKKSVLIFYLIDISL